ncbi:MAG: N-acetyltransferase [Pseudomonadota bacterium]
MTSKGISIRPAGDGDEGALWSLLEPVFRAGETYCQPRDIGRADALAYWLGDHLVFLAEAEAALGTYFIGANAKGGGAHVCNCGFVTAAASQGRGVARAMLEHALATAVDQGYRAMQFNFVVANNLRALALWSSYGFEEVGRLPEAFRDPRGAYQDALVMVKRL